MKKNIALYISMFCMLCLAVNVSGKNVVINKSASSPSILMNILFDEQPKSIYVTPPSILDVVPTESCWIWSVKISVITGERINNIWMEFKGDLAKRGIGPGKDYPAEWFMAGYAKNNKGDIINKINCYDEKGKNFYNSELLIVAVEGSGELEAFSSTPGLKINVTRKNTSKIFSFVTSKALQDRITLEVKTTPPVNMLTVYGGNVFPLCSIKTYEPFEGGWLFVEIEQVFNPFLAPSKTDTPAFVYKYSKGVLSEFPTTWGNIKTGGQ